MRDGCGCGKHVLEHSVYESPFHIRVSAHATEALRACVLPCLHLLRVLLSCRSPAKANNTIIDGLGEADAASFKKAVQLCQLYSLNKTTPDIWQFIIGTVQAEGSFSGMLRKLTVPLMHNGYRLPKARAG